MSVYLVEQVVVLLIAHSDVADPYLVEVAALTYIIADDILKPNDQLRSQRGWLESRGICHKLCEYLLLESVDCLCDSWVVHHDGKGAGRRALHLFYDVRQADPVSLFDILKHPLLDFHTIDLDLWGLQAMRGFKVSIIRHLYVLRGYLAQLLQEQVTISIHLCWERAQSLLKDVVQLTQGVPYHLGMVKGKAWI